MTMPQCISSLSDISDTTYTVKKEINCNLDNSGVEITSDGSVMSYTPPTKNHSGFQNNMVKMKKPYTIAK